MNTFLKYLFYLIIVISISSCSDESTGLLTKTDKDDLTDEYISIPLRIELDSIECNTKSETLNDISLKCDYIEIQVFYDNKLLEDYYSSYSEHNHSLISNMTKSEYGYTFDILFPKRWDPSKISFFFKTYDLMGLNVTGGISHSINRREIYKNYTSIYHNINHSTFPSHIGIFQLADTDDWNNISTLFPLTNAFSHLIILSDEFFVYPIPESEFPYSNGWYKYKPLTFEMGFLTDQSYQDYYSVYNSFSGVNYFTFKTNIITTYDYESDKLYCELKEIRCTNADSSNTLINRDEENNATVLFQGNKYSKIIDIFLLSSKSGTIPLIKNNDGTYSEAKYLEIRGRTANRVTNSNNNIDEYVLYAYGLLPIPEGGFEANHRYIMYNAPATRLFDTYQVKLYYSQSFHARIPEYTLIKNATALTKGTGNYIIEEYDMNEDLPFEMCNSEIPFSK